MLKKTDILYPELSYRIMGCAFEVFNTLGAGLLEKQYQKAMSIEFGLRKITYTEQAYYPREYKGINIAKGFMDFLVEKKIVVELKRGDHFSRGHIQQVSSYLEYAKLELGILIQFTKDGVRQKRILNIQ